MRIFITGFMGAGKTHWGKIWADELGVPFLDLDASIVAQQQRSIADIFEQEGEDFFRNIESIALRNTAAIKDCVVACGGGTPCYLNNMEWMNNNGQTVYISVPPITLQQRLLQESASRPLIRHLNSQQLLSFIEMSLDERMPFYKQAVWLLDEQFLTPQTIRSIL